MSPGKLSAQVAHAAVTCVLQMLRKDKKYQEWIKEWEKQGQKKVVLQVGNIEELLNLYNKAISDGLPTCIIKDAGLTELEPGTITCIGIGPAPEELIDEITRTLKLL